MTGNGHDATRIDRLKAAVEKLTAGTDNLLEGMQNFDRAGERGPPYCNYRTAG